MPPVASVIVLGYGKEDYLESCLGALLDDLGGEDELILVDNGIHGAAGRLPDLPGRVRVIGGGRNQGFAGGCNFAARHASGALLLFVNSDAIVRPGAVGALKQAADRRGGIVGGCLRLADQPDLVNSVGNPLQFLGVTWAGACGEPASAHQSPGPVAVATGGLFALRRDLWDELGGFDDQYFAYHEDTDLSLRAWLTGHRVDYEPTAVADHYYEFSRNPLKMYLVERNRLFTVLTDYPRPLLLAALPMLLVLEPALLAAAALQGWHRQKLSSWWWLLRHAGAVRRRRFEVQATVTVPSSRVAALMVSRIAPPMVPSPAGMPVLNALLELYWSAALVALRRGDRRRGVTAGTAHR